MNEQDIWVRIVDSGLFGVPTVDKLKAQFRAESGNGEPHADGQILQWLSDKSLLSTFQNRVLAAGLAGPFRFGEYQVDSRVGEMAEGATTAWFKAFHVPTRFPVSLQFFAGKELADAERWAGVRSQAQSLQSCTNPTFIRYYDAIELAEYRFIVWDRLQSTPLALRLGPNGRLSWQMAVALIALLSEAVSELHAAGQVHGHLNCQTFHLESNGTPRLLLPTVANDAETFVPAKSADATSMEPVEHYRPPQTPPFDATLDGATADVYSLGALLYRMIRGSTMMASVGKPDRWSPEHLLRKLEKHELPASLFEFFESLVRLKPGETLPSAADLANLCRKHANDAKHKISRFQPPAVQTDFVEHLNRWIPGKAKPDSALPVAIVIDSEQKSELTDSGSRPVEVDVLQFEPRDSQRSRSNDSEWILEQQRRASRRRRRVPLIIGSIGLVLFVVTLGVIWRVAQNFRSAESTSTPVTVADSNQLSPIDATNVTDTGTGNPGEIESTATGLWSQQVVADDGQLLWESPTSGPTIDLSRLPLGPNIVMHVRLDAARSDEQVSLLMAALGAENATADFITGVLGTQVDRFDELLIGCYPTEQRQYELCYLLRTSQGCSPTALTDYWLADGFRADEEVANLLHRADQSVAFWVADEPNAAPTLPSETETNNESSLEPIVTTLLIGSPDLVAPSLKMEIQQPLTGPLERLVDRTDRDRLATVLALKSALFTEEGRRLMDGPFQALNRPFSLWMPDEIRAVGCSVHLDNGLYVELFFEHSADITATRLRDKLSDKLSSLREQVIASVAQSVPNDYWRRVHQRFDNMLIAAFQSIRTGVEYDQVLLNAWLPEMAGHNLLVATELTLSASGFSQGVAAVAGSATPQTIDELLQVRRDLVDANPPDLNIIMESLQQQIRDRFPDLPFQFEIQLSNNDLREGGITRNQRPAALDLRDQPLEQILTSIVFLANPDKNATSPADVRCKLVWVLQRDEPENISRVLITTREGVRKNGWVLPAPFVAESSE